MWNFFCGSKRNEIHVFNLFAVVGNNTISPTAAEVGIQQRVRNLIFLCVWAETNNTNFLRRKKKLSHKKQMQMVMKRVANHRTNHLHLCPRSTNFLNVVPDYLRGDSTTYLDVVRKILQTQFIQINPFKRLADTLRMCF